MLVAASVSVAEAMPVSLGPTSAIVQAPTAPAVAPVANEHPSDAVLVIELTTRAFSRTNSLGPRAYVTALVVAKLGFAFC
jgi:hypothetical protein